MEPIQIQTLPSLIGQNSWSQVHDRIATYPTEVHFWNHGKLPIHLACQLNAPLSVIQTLIQLHPTSLQTFTKSRLNALHYAVSSPWRSYYQILSLVQLLLRQYPQGAAVVDMCGFTPLLTYLHCTPRPVYNIVRMLVEAYPDAVHSCNMFHFFPLHYASFRGDTSIAHYLLELYPEAYLKQTSQSISLDIYNGGCSVTIPKGSTPSDIAQTRAWLCSKKSSDVSLTPTLVDGPVPVMEHYVPTTVIPTTDIPTKSGCVSEDDSISNVTPISSSNDTLSPTNTQDAKDLLYFSDKVTQHAHTQSTNKQHMHVIDPPTKVAKREHHHSPPSQPSNESMSQETNTLTVLTYLNQRNWIQVLNRIASHPKEVQYWHTQKLPIFDACQKEHIPITIIKALIQAFPISLECTNDANFNALHFAVSSSTQPPKHMFQIVQLLIHHYPEAASVTALGFTPLHTYLQNCVTPTMELVKMLVEAYPPAVSTCNIFHLNPLHYAALRSNGEVAQYLFQFYPDASRERMLIDISLESVQGVGTVKIPSGSTPGDITTTLMLAKKWTKKGPLQKNPYTL